MTTGSAHAPPIQPCTRPSAVMIARDPSFPEDGRLPPDHRGQGELLAAAGHLGGRGQDLPAVEAAYVALARRFGHHESVLIGGAPETSCRWVMAS